MENKFDLGKELNKFGFKLSNLEHPLENKFNQGKELRDKIQRQTDQQALQANIRKTRERTFWQTWNQTYLQITYQIKESANEK